MSIITISHEAFGDGRAVAERVAESLQAVKDLTITARVEAVLIASSRLHISNLEVQTRCGEVHVSGMIVAAGLEQIVADAVRKIPGVTRVKTHFVVTPSEHCYLYADGR